MRTSGRMRSRGVLIGVLSACLLGACTSVTLEMPEGPVFPGSYVRVPVVVSGIAIEDVEFVIPAGSPAGEISPSRDASYDPAQPDIVLLAGHLPGDYVLEARRKSDALLLAEGKFSLDARWPNDADGPSLWFAGIVPQSSGVPGAAWGGGPAGSPQNFDVMPALGTRQVNIVLVDTSTRRYTTDPGELAAIKNKWSDEAVKSSNYYGEVSYGAFGLSTAVFGPVQLPGAWEDYFDPVEHPQGFDVWRPANNFYQACATAADALIAFSAGQSLVCVSQSADDEQFAWPYARPEIVSTAEGATSIGGVSMPFNWETVDGRPIHTTLSHELGHNLGLSDLYSPEVFMFNPPTQPRNPGGWDIMGSSGGLPHFSLPHRMLLGWINQSDIELFNFQVQVPPVDQTVTLHPAELASPPSGRRHVAEVRVADGWNYYFEYRKRQSSQFADQTLPADNRIIGVDVWSSPFDPPMARPPILLLDNDPDVDGSVLGNGSNYREVDSTDPMFPTDFTVTASGIDGDKASLRVQYGVFSKPDPYIRPWPAAADRQWQSPDIEVKNARNAAKPEWFNVPWVGHDNTIVATVTNGGALTAPGVEVRVKEKNFNLGGVTITRVLGSVTKDVPPLGKVDFEVPWVPPTGGHYCIRVEILQYTSPGGVAETSGSNNVAQSNYSRFISAMASPPSREIAIVEVGNPFNKPTRVFIVPSQTNPFYRTFLQHRWLMLEAGEVKQVQVMFEFAPEAVQKAGPEPDKAFLRKPNDARFVSWIEDPRFGPPDAADLFSGAQVEVVTGRATEFATFEASAERARGRVVTVDNKQPVPGDKVLLIVEDSGGKKSYEQVAFTSGDFFSPLPKGWRKVTAYYPGRENFGDATSQTREQ